ncbi:hypothetical protein FQZ97_741900 [compost metagenome]
MGGAAADRAADGGVALHDGLGVGGPQGRRDHGLGRAVGVHDACRVQHAADQREVFAGPGLAAEEREAHGVLERRLVLQQLARIGRRQVDHADAVALQQGIEFAGERAPLRLQHQCGAGGQRQQALLDGGVDVRQRELQRTIARREAAGISHGL